MIDFLKSFFTGDKPAPQKQRDVMVLDGYAMEDDAEEEQGGCGSSSSGCGRCGCG